MADTDDARMKRIDALISGLETQLNGQIILIIATEDLEKSDATVFNKHILPKINPDQDAVLLILGPGGNTSAGFNMALDIREKLQHRHIDCLVPRRAGSAFGYFAYLSDRILLTKTSELTQIDMVWNDQRAKDMIKTGRTADEKRDAQHWWGFHGRLMTALRTESPLFITRLPKHFKTKNSEILKSVDKLMRGNKHETPVRYSDLGKLHIRHLLLDPGDSVMKDAMETVTLASDHLDSIERRLFIRVGSLELEL